MKRKGFKSFVLKLCESKGFADTFLRKCINLKELAQKVGAHGWLGADLRRLAGPAEPSGMQTAHICRFPWLFPFDISQGKAYCVGVL